MAAAPSQGLRGTGGAEGPGTGGGDPVVAVTRCPHPGCGAGPGLPGCGAALWGRPGPCAAPRGDAVLLCWSLPGLPHGCPPNPVALAEEAMIGNVRPE